MPELPQPTSKASTPISQRLPKPPYAGLFQEPAFSDHAALEDDISPEDGPEFKTGF